MGYWNDDQRAWLTAAFPAWEVWYIRMTLVKRTLWCARPRGAPGATVWADSPDEIHDTLARMASPAGQEGEAFSPATVTRSVPVSR